MVRERIGQLRDYGWSSYRAYVGLDRPPEWLECGRVLELGGGQVKNQARQYRQYVEGAFREGTPKSPWEQLRTRTVLGGAKFARKIAAAFKGGSSKDPRRRKLAGPSIEELMGAVEAVKDELRFAGHNNRTPPHRGAVACA